METDLVATYASVTLRDLKLEKPANVEIKSVMRRMRATAVLVEGIQIEKDDVFAFFTTEQALALAAVSELPIMIEITVPTTDGGVCQLNDNGLEFGGEQVCMVGHVGQVVRALAEARLKVKRITGGMGEIKRFDVDCVGGEQQ